MAKNTSSSEFRKIDVDQFNEDNFKEDDADQGGPTGPDDSEITLLLNQYPFQCASTLVEYVIFSSCLFTMEPVVILNAQFKYTNSVFAL